jgi:hypothetical protein
MREKKTNGYPPEEPSGQMMFSALVPLRGRCFCPHRRSKTASGCRPEPCPQQIRHSEPTPFSHSVSGAKTGSSERARTFVGSFCRTGPSPSNRPVCHRRRCKSEKCPAGVMIGAGPGSTTCESNAPRRLARTGWPLATCAVRLYAPPRVQSSLPARLA